MLLSAAARALIPDDAATWNGGSRQPTLVAFNFATAAGGPNPTTGGQDWASFDAAQQQALGSWTAVSGLRLIEVPDTLGGAGIDLRFQLTALPAGYVWHPGAGDINLDLSFAARATGLASGSHGYLMLLHETGHALGLRHPSEGRPGGAGLLAESPVERPDARRNGGRRHNSNEFLTLGAGLTEGGIVFA